MSFPCKKCPKKLSSKQSLKHHMKKSVPCDFQCRQCDFKANTRDGFNWHCKSMHTNKVKIKHPVESVEPVKAPQENVILDEEVSAIEPVEKRFPRMRVRLPGMPERPQTNLIPMEDFDPQCMRELAALANKENVEIVLERIRMTIRPLRRKRAEEAVKSFQTSDYAHSLQCLQQDVNKTAAGILSKFHGDPERPHLHTIHMGDLSRKTVNIYSRPSEEAPTQWLSFAKEPALTTLSEHASVMLQYALEMAANMLQYKFCAKEKTVCFCLHDAVQSKNLIIVDENDFDSANDGDILASLGYKPRLKVLFYDDVLTDIVQGFGYTEKACQLGLLINQKTEEVLEQLKVLALKEEDIFSFLERTRRPITSK